MEITREWLESKTVYVGLDCGRASSERIIQEAILEYLCELGFKIKLGELGLLRERRRIL